MTFKVAVAQIDIALGEPDRNYQTVTQAVKDAAKAGADVVVFPEMWNTGYALTELARQPYVLAVNITIRPISMIKTGT